MYAEFAASGFSVSLEGRPTYENNSVYGNLSVRVTDCVLCSEYPVHTRSELVLVASD